LLKARVEKSFGEFSVSADIALEWPGITVLFGKSGAGKTTLINMIAGLIRPDSGFISCGDRIFFDSGNSIALPPERRGLGYVFQEHRLFPHMSVRNNMLFGPKFCGRACDRSKFDKAVEILGIGHLLSRHPGTLSGGESQRVAIGRAVLACTSLLLMDEPMASIDRERKEDLLGYVKKIPENFGVPIIYVTHSETELSYLADRVIVMNDGRIVRERADNA
jgi:molybdate transport system ATP-binding protein